MLKKFLMLVPAAALVAGCGVMPYDDSVYQGVKFAGPELNDAGYYEFSGGVRYTGSLVEGKPEGQGKLEYPNGDVYQGAFSRGLINGEGEFRYADSRVYQGIFVLEQPKGPGKLTLKDGAYYEGQFDGLSSISGRYVTSKGTYEGDFKQGNLDGIYTFQKNGSKVDRRQTFSDGELVYDVPGPKAIAAGKKRCKVKGKEWVFVQGGCSGGWASGRAEAMTLDYTTVAKGRFKSGALVNGVLETQDGQKYEGGFANYKPHGKSKEYRSGEKVYDGGFRQGERHGKGICLIGGKPQRCEFYNGERMDSGYLASLFKQDMEQAEAQHQERLAQIEAKTRRAERSWEEDYRAKMEYIQDEIDSAEAAVVGKGLMSGLTNMGNEAAMQAQIAGYAEEERRRKAELRELERNFNSEQAEAKRRFARVQKEEVREANQRYERELEDLKSKHRRDCSSFPPMRWDGSRNLCVKR